MNGFQEKYQIEFWTGQSKHSGTSAETTPDCFTDLSAVLLILKLKIFRTLSGIGLSLIHILIVVIVIFFIKVLTELI